MRVLDIVSLVSLLVTVCLFRVSFSRDDVYVMEQETDGNSLRHDGNSNTSETAQKEDQDELQNEPKNPENSDLERQASGTQDAMNDDHTSQHSERKQGEEGTKEGEKNVRETKGETEVEEGIERKDNEINIDVSESTGNGTNCGPKESHLSFHWTPAVIDPQGSVKIRLKMTAPVSFAYGILTIDVAVGGQSHPIFTIAMDVSCEEDIAKNVPKDIKLHCPIQKGMPFPAIPFTENNLTRLPTGTFDVKITVKNENNEVFLCLQFSVELKPED